MTNPLLVPRTNLDLQDHVCVSEDMAKLAHHRYVQSDLRAAFLDGVRAEMARHQWQPIETAPQDGTLILATDGKEIFRTHGSFGHVWIPNGKGGHMPDPERKSFSWLAYVFDSLTPWRPTHWMPLPAPPSSEATHAR